MGRHVLPQVVVHDQKVLILIAGQKIKHRLLHQVVVLLQGVPKAGKKIRQKFPGLHHRTAAVAHLRLQRVVGRVLRILRIVVGEADETVLKPYFIITKQGEKLILPLFCNLLVHGA